MKTNSKSLVSLLLVLAMFLSVMPGMTLVAAAAETTTVVLTDGVSVVEGYDDYVGKDWVSLLGMPETVVIDGAEAAVTWENAAKYVNLDQVGTYAVPGTVNGVANAVAFIVRVHAYNNLVADKNSNLDGSWGTHWENNGTKDPETPFVTEPVIDGEYATNQVCPATWTDARKAYQLMYTKAYSSGLNRTNDYATRVATEGAGDYWFGIYGITAGDTLGEADGNMMLRVNVSRATNTDDLTKPSYDADRALVSKSVLLNKESYSRTGSYAYFDGTDSHIRFYVYAHGENIANDRVHLDKFELVQIKKAVKFENIPAEITSVAAQPVYGLQKNYDQYAGENWQEALALPAQVEITLADGTTAMVNVSWDFSRVDLSTEGTYVVVGDLDAADYLNPNALKAKQFIQVQEFANLIAYNPDMNVTADKNGNPILGSWTVDNRYHDSSKLENVAYGENGQAAKLVAVEGAKFGRLTYNGSTSQTALGKAIAASGVGQYWISIDVWADAEVVTTCFPRLFVYYGSKSVQLNIPAENRVAFGTSVQTAGGIVTVDSLTKDLDGNGTEDAIAKAMFAVEKSVSNDKTPVTYIDNAKVLPLKVTLDIAPVCEHTPAEAVAENVIPAECEVEGFYNAVVYCANCGELMSRTASVIDALEHIYEATLTEPTCSAAGYTTYDCTLCGDSYKEAGDPATGEHDFVDGVCSVCGAEDVPAGPEKADDLVFVQAPSLAFQDYIGVQVAIMNSVAQSYDKVYLRTVQQDPEKGAVTVDLTGMPFYFDMLFAFDHPVLSWSMTEEFTLTLYGEKDGKVYVGQSFTSTVEEMALAMLEKYAATHPLNCQCLVDMLNYGAEVQKAFSHNVENLPNTKIDAYASMGTHTTPELSGVTPTVGTGIDPAQISISMMAKVEFQALFMMDISAYTPKAMLNGEAVEVIIDTETYGAYGWTVVSFAASAANFRDTFEFALYDAEGNAVSDVYSLVVEAYANKQIGGVYNDVAIAMMRYGDAVSAYVATLG